MAARGDISLGDFVAMVFYLNMLAAPTGVLGFVISSLQRGTAALGRVGEILDSEPSILQGSEVDLPRGEIAVKGLSVTLENAKGEPRKVLDDIVLTVPSGTVLGVVGATGSGKSVLLQALARQLEVDQGRVFFDGKEAHAYRLKELREQIGYVPQEAFLFSMSLAENVALGRPDAPKEDIAAAILASRLEQDLTQLPQGYDTLVGERGLNLSGGQRQRTALARVLLLKPKMLLLDDPFSAVDASTTDEILNGLKPFFAERTTVLVAHRVATVQHADLIVVMEEGRIIERGTHAKLLEFGGAYAALHQRQQERASLREELGEEPLG
jgi:ATP-binding cassette subfamily B protein